MKVPSFMLKKLYVGGSLANENGGVTFRLKNTMATATLTAFPEMSIDGVPLEPEDTTISLDDEEYASGDVSEDAGIPFKKNAEVKVFSEGRTLEPGDHAIAIKAESKEWQTLAFEVEDTLDA